MDDKKKEVRKQKRLEALGTNYPVCVICGESNWCCLEEHHIAGRAYGDELAVVCRNCHRKLSDDQKDHPKSGPVIGKTQSIGYLLIGLADLFHLLAPSLRRYGEYLIQAVEEDLK